MAVPHICIVGAGPAGLRCATVLLEQGCKVTLVEARNRIGGRVRTQTNLQILDHHFGLIHDCAGDAERSDGALGG